jgi:hypothetical protein
VGHFFWARWGASSKWFKVDVYFSLGLGGEFPASYLQGGGGPVLIWFLIVHPNIHHKKGLGEWFKV